MTSIVKWLAKLCNGRLTIEAMSPKPACGKFIIIGESLSEPHTSESPPQDWCYRPCTKNYDKNRVTYACDENSTT